jgi:hypothetical protein
MPDVQVSLKEMGVAVTECIGMRDVFDRDTVTHVLGRLVEMEPLPQLIMRTLINVWHVHPDMQRSAACSVSLLYCIAQLSHMGHMCMRTHVKC